MSPDCQYAAWCRLPGLQSRPQSRPQTDQKHSAATQAGSDHRLPCRCAMLSPLAVYKHWRSAQQLLSQALAVAAKPKPTESEASAQVLLRQLLVPQQSCQAL